MSTIESLTITKPKTLSIIYPCNSNGISLAEKLKRVAIIMKKYPDDMIDNINISNIGIVSFTRLANNKFEDIFYDINTMKEINRPTK